MKRFRHTLWFFIFFAAFPAQAQIRLPRLISSGMVLQRDSDLKLWGWAAPHEKIVLTFKDSELKTEADAAGKWAIRLTPQQAGGPYEMSFTASNKIVLTNILFGDVWVCSGQSNMELAMDRVKDKYPDVIANAENADIRQFIVPDQYDFESRYEDVTSGEWLPVNAKNILSFSAVAYFFASDLFNKYKIPIGLINASLGGAPAQAWMSEDALKVFPEYFNEAQRFKNKKLIYQIDSSDKSVSDKWHAQLNQHDDGLRNHWRQEKIDDHDWRLKKIPGYWNEGEKIIGNGVVWFRREVKVPPYMTGKRGRIVMGRIVDADSIFINGTFVGTTSYQYPPRKYNIPANLLKAGENVISMRVISNSGNGGFVYDKPYLLVVGNDSIDLRGEWKYKVGATLEPLLEQTFIRWKPLGLFNAMIAPLLNYKIKGTIWYQGEANTKNPAEYALLMPGLITDWRTQWKQKDLPFLFVQLSSFMAPKKEPTESNWAETRRAQLSTLQVPHTGMAVTIDIGEWNDIHPMNKKDVGHRLALQAMRVAYGESKIVASGPLLQTVTREGNKLVLSFSELGSGLLARGDEILNSFSVAGADRKFVWAHARIAGDKVMVWSDTVTDPVVVRYAWADCPLDANLYNKELLPASPFEGEIRN